jgi:phage terminase large subunit
MTTARIELPPKLVDVFSAPRGMMRYRGAFGGRGSAKSFTFALMAAVWGYAEPLRILCTRELQVSIKESFHAEVKNAIASTPWLAAHYDVGIDYIRGKNGTEFIFRGLRHNIGSIKSMAQIDLCIVEEAEDVPESSWLDLEPTIRAPKSEIWVVWNPKRDGSPVDKRFRKNSPPRSAIVEMNYLDNPWFPAELEEQRLHNQATMDDATYQHIWLGQYLQHSQAQIFRNKFRVSSFEPDSDWDGPYNGLDFGYASDPTAGVECWINNKKLYVRREAGKTGLELDQTAAYLVERIPSFEQFPVRADNARPESISYLRRGAGGRALKSIVACSKGKGSVEDGIAFIGSFDEVVIHPDCTSTAEEFRNYSYKIDRLTGDILPVIVDDWNHYIDAIRYALEPIMKRDDKAGLLLPSRYRRRA